MQQRGFTLIEMLLSVTIIGLLAGLSLPVFQSFNTRNDLDITTQSLVSALRRAQVYAKAGKEDSVWGVSVQPTAITLYKGTSFAGRDQPFDEVTTIASSTMVGGVTDITFTKLTGRPSTTASVTLTNSNNDSRTVTMNDKGMVAY